MANLTNSNKLIGKFAQIDSDISNIKESLPADGVGEGVITLGINDEGLGDFNVNQKTNKSINFIINRNTVGLGNVNNTSDMDKPVSTAQQAALDLKADKVDTYTKVEVDDLLAGIAGLEIRKVDKLPDEGENGVIYLVPSTSAKDTYDEYIWVASDSAFEKIGNTNIDLSNYYDKDEVDNLLDQKADASDIPTVNDGTLDIQLNGTSVETFSANSENNKTANIEVTKSTVGLGNVDNTSDADKPISTATQAALDLKADKSDIDGVIKFGDNQVDNMYTSISDTNGNLVEFYPNSFYVENEDGDVEEYDFFGDSRIARLNETMRGFPVPQRGDDISKILEILKRNEPVYFYEKREESYNIWVVQSFVSQVIKSYMNNKGEYLDVWVNDNGWECDGHTVANADLVYQQTYTWHLLPSNNTWDGSEFSQYRETSSSFTVNGNGLFRMGFEYKLKVKNTGQSTITVTLGNKLLNPRNIPTTIAKGKEVIFLFYSSHNTMSTMELAQRIEYPLEGEDLSNYYNKSETDELLDEKADKSELPTVNDARITVQKNSESVDSFTLNQNTDNIINITIDKNDVGLDKVDNTSDADKPISDATQAALDLKADKTELPTVNDASVTVKQGTATKGSFTLNQAGDVTIELDEGGDGDVKYADFEFAIIAQSPDGEAIIGQMLSGILNLNRDLTLLPHDELKAGMQYLVRVNNTDSTDHDVTFDGVAYTVKAGETKNLVFLAVDGSTLELQECTGGGGGGQVPNNGVLTIADKGGNTLGTFTADQSSNTSVVVGNMSYEDFHSVNDTTSPSIPLQLTGEVTPTQNFTLQAGAYKEGMVYIMRIYSGSNPYTMSLGSGLTNPFNVDLTLTPDGVDQFVFLAINNEFELQPQLLTRADVEQILRDYNLIP